VGINTGSRKIFISKALWLLALFVVPMTSAYGQAFLVHPIGTSMEGGRHYLNMRVWNCTNHDVVIPLPNLPWGEHTLGLVLYTAPGKLAGEPLKQQTLIADFPDTKVKIQAKGYVDGRVDLESQFPDIPRYEKHVSLLIFWEYDVSLIAGGDSRFVGGMIPLGMPPGEDGLPITCKS
jgi:hypothetical protein